MAMVLDAFASYLQRMLMDMAKEEVHMLFGVTGEMDKMGVKLGDLKNFLADADRRKINDKTVQEWVGQLKRAMYEATDILDLCQLQAMKRVPSRADVACFNPLLFCLRNPLHAHDIATRIKALNERLDNIKQRSEAFNFLNLGSYEGRGGNMHTDRPGNPSRETSGELDRSGVVGEKIEEDTRALVAKIMKPRNEANDNLMVVAIVGVGGIGKTTLAQQLFNDKTIQCEFTKKIWLSVNKDYREAELLKRAITEAEGDHQPAGDAKATLHRTLKNVLTGHKTLLVLDDLWSQEAWESVLKIPLINAVARGSLVLVTTRDERVARGIKAVLPYHHVDKLGDDDAWELLKKQVVSSEKDCAEIDLLRDIGLQIVKKCGGLPLTVKVVGGLLRQKGKQRQDWEMILNDSIWSVSNMPQELNYAVYLSYEDLSPSVKQCFLYYSLLPKGVLFPRDTVISMWISEGFVHGTSDDLEDLGKEYYEDLILRNLIEPNKEGNIDQSSCTMHDIVRSFAQFVARDEALAIDSEETDIITKLSAHSYLRLSVESSESDGLAWSSLQEQKTLRTLISVGHINMKPGDSLVDFPCLRTLNMDYAKNVAFIYSLDKLKHLRYLSIDESEISCLPDNIGNLKFLQFISLHECEQCVRLPPSIVDLRQLRSLDIEGTAINDIPRGFCVLTNLRSLEGFPAKEDGDWCSLEELGPLSELRTLGIRGLENVSSTLSAEKAKLAEKVHLTELSLMCSKLENGGVINEVEHQQIEEVFDELCPQACLAYLRIEGYFGRRFPRWMMSSSDVPLKNLKFLFMDDLACCTQLPDGLCQIPYLEFIQVEGAPSIKRLGPEFLQPYYHPAMPKFPRLHTMNLIRMVEWEEWEWDEQVEAFPVLEKIVLTHCKLRRIPPGLAFHARALKKLDLSNVQQIKSLENFACVIELELYSNPALERITNLPNLQKITIIKCGRLKVLEGVPALQRLILKDYTMETLPEYLRVIKPKQFQLFCRPWLLASVAMGQSGPEWGKFSHVEDLKAYASNEDNGVEWYVVYTRDPSNLETNIRRPTKCREILSSSMLGARGFERVFKMRRSTFNYICSLVRLPCLEDMMARDHTFNDGRVLSLQDRVAVALIMLNSGEPPETVGSSVGVHESTVSLVTKMFLEAIQDRAKQHSRRPNSSAIEKIKSKFDKIHGLQNCCGVLHTTVMTFVSAESNSDHAENDSIQMQVLVDPHMRFIHFCVASEGSKKQFSILQDSDMFKHWKKGLFLNGRKMKVSDGSEIGEYIIGDAGHSLLPWLITPYQEEDLPHHKVEFNRRHSIATAVALRALAELKDTWKFLHGLAWRPQNINELCKAVRVCCRLHNIVIDMEEGLMPNGANFNKQLRQFADEDAVRVRDILSQHLTSMPSQSEGILSILVGTQGFESVFKMSRKTFNYVCNLVRVPSLEDMRSYTFLDGRVMCTEDLVAIALRVLTSGEPLETIGCSLGVKESTVFLVTWTFIDAMHKLPIQHYRWPDTSEMAMIKSKFDRIYGLSNCCGAIHTTNLNICLSSPKSVNCKKIASLVMQAIVGPDMRILDIALIEACSSWNQSTILPRSNLFKRRMKGELLNVSSDGSEVGEYIVGDAGYPLLPWLITPYQEENLTYCKAEFNMRHSTATTSVMRVLTRFKETWKFSYGEVWRPNTIREMAHIVVVCSILHNIVIDMDDDAATTIGEASMPKEHDMNYRQQVCRFRDENAVRVRDIMSKQLTSRPSQSGGTFSFVEDNKIFESVFKMTRRTFKYLCSLMELWSPQHMSRYTFLDGRVLSLDDQVAISLIMLNSGDLPDVVGTSVGMEVATVWSITWSFVEAILELASHHFRWPDADEMEMIKSRFDKTHGFPNCCGVLHRTHIKMSPPPQPNYEIFLDNEKNYSMIMQVVVDPDMRFRSLDVFAGSFNGSTILQSSFFFGPCEKGELLNGSKMKVSSDGAEVGEYIIGDPTNPLLPWLITPYQLEEDLSDTKAGFNRRLFGTAATTARALKRLRETWKYMNAMMICNQNNINMLLRIIHVCCVLHNIVIDMEGDAAMNQVPVRSDQEVRYNQQVRQLAEEDAVMARDALAQHLTSRSSRSRDHATSGGTVPSAGTSAGAVPAVNYRYRWRAGLMALSIFVVLVAYLIKCMTEDLSWL